MYCVCLIQKETRAGSAFLEAFLEIAKVDWVITNGCTVYTEKQLMDNVVLISILFGGNIGIENKPWAGDKISYRIMPSI